MLRNWKLWAGLIGAGIIIVKAPGPAGQAAGTFISGILNAVVAFIKALPAFFSGFGGHGHG